MYYNSFLVLLSQLAFQEEGKISLNGCDILVKSFPHSSYWELKTEFSTENLPSNVCACLRSGRKLLLEAKNIYLQKNHETVAFVQTIQRPKKYLQYKQCIEAFFASLSLWKETSLSH